MDRFRDTGEIRDADPDRARKVNLFETDRFFLDVHVLGRGQAQRVHAHEGEDKCYHVLSGRPTVTCGDDERVCSPGTIVFCPAGVPHGVRNEGDEPARLLVFMAPHPRARPARP